MTTHRTPLIAGNWKLHLGLREARELATTVRETCTRGGVDVAVAPVFTALAAVRDALAGSQVKLAAQDCYWQKQGAFTGEVSPALLADAGCTMCIVGHSERRQYFGETDDTVAKKTAALLADGLVPIVCVGETLEERERGRTLERVRTQLDGALVGLSAEHVGTLVVAYEPVWAIGTGRNASPSDAQEVHAAIRARLAESFGADAAAKTRVLYGGSMKPDNAKDLLAQPDIDGGLVGGASLNAASFAAIVGAA